MKNKSYTEAEFSKNSSEFKCDFLSTYWIQNTRFYIDDFNQAFNQYLYEYSSDTNAEDDYIELFFPFYSAALGGASYGLLKNSIHSKKIMTKLTSAVSGAGLAIVAITMGLIPMLRWFHSYPSIEMKIEKITQEMSKDDLKKISNFVDDEENLSWYVMDALIHSLRKALKEEGFQILI